MAPPKRRARQPVARTLVRALRTRVTQLKALPVQLSPSRHSLRSKGEPEPLAAYTPKVAIPVQPCQTLHLVIIKKFPFQKLPPEIRNTIYKMAFITPEYIGKNSATLKNFRKEASKVRHLSFAMTCKQIYEESAGIFFGYNGFSFQDPDLLLRFLQAIGIRNRERLTKLAYIHDCSFKWEEAFSHESAGDDDFDGYLVKEDVRSASYAFPALRYLKSCINIQTLDVYLLVEMNDFYTEVIHMEDAKKLFMTTSTVVKWGEPRMMSTLNPEVDEGPDEKRSYSTVVPLDLEQLGISSKLSGWPFSKKFMYFSAEGTEMFNESDEEADARKDAMAKFVSVVRDVKCERPKFNDKRSSARHIRRLPNVFADSKHKTEAYGTNFQTSQEEDIATFLHKLISPSEDINMSVEYGPRAEAAVKLAAKNEEAGIQYTPKSNKYNSASAIPKTPRKASTSSYFFSNTTTTAASPSVSPPNTPRPNSSSSNSEYLLSSPPSNPMSPPPVQARPRLRLRVRNNPSPQPQVQARSQPRPRLTQNSLASPLASL